MRAVIVANGELQSSPRLQDLWARANLRIAADGGARNARLFLQHPPHILIGDMDSVDEETQGWLDASHVPLIQHPRAKDETDLELALRLAQERGADEILILGAFGGRLDHFVANVMLLTQAHNVKLADAASEMWVGSGNEEIQGRKGDTVSLIPLDEQVDGITTIEMEYPLRGETLARGSTRGISNVMLGERAQVSWARGTLLILHLFQ